MIMFSYGSNLCMGQMRRRCPNATPLGRVLLPDWRLVFRGVADCVCEPGAVCHGGLWRITSACERALDRYEGVAGGAYRKEFIRLEDRPNEDVLIYCMNATGVLPPAVRYLASITEGYRDFAMPEAAFQVLAAAVRAAWDDKATMRADKPHHRRNGAPAACEDPPPIGGHALRPADRRP